MCLSRANLVNQGNYNNFEKVVKLYGSTGCKRFNAERLGRRFGRCYPGAAPPFESGGAQYCERQYCERKGAKICCSPACDVLRGATENKVLRNCHENLHHNSYGA